MVYIEGLARGEGHEQREIGEEPLDPQTLVATRPFLTNARMEGRRRRASRGMPEVVSTGGTDYVVDGHHKVRRACDAGDPTITCKVLRTSSPRLRQRLARMSHGLIAILPIR